MIIGVVRVLFVSVCVKLRATNVSDVAGSPMVLLPLPAVSSVVPTPDVLTERLVTVAPVIVGDVCNTTEPDPVAVVAPVPPLAIGSVPVTPVVSGSPVTFVITPDVGVPSAGVTSVGDVANTGEPVPVAVVEFHVDPL